jgi:hypothetical protein
MCYDDTRERMVAGESPSAILSALAELLESDDSTYARACGRLLATPSRAASASTSRDLSVMKNNLFGISLLLLSEALVLFGSFMALMRARWCAPSLKTPIRIFWIKVLMVVNMISLGLLFYLLLGPWVPMSSLTLAITAHIRAVALAVAISIFMSFSGLGYILATLYLDQQATSEGSR